MTRARPTSGWLRHVRAGDSPIYLALVEALETAVREGELQPGDQLAPQRAVADGSQVAWTQPGDHEVPVDIFDTQGTKVFHARITMNIKID